MPHLTLNKRVRVLNFRINVVYYSLLFITSAAFLLKIICWKEYIRSVNSSEYVKATLWADKANTAEMAAMWEQKSQEPLCKSPRDYDYWWDGTGEWAYVNNSCLPLCQHGMPTNRCINPFELHVLESQSQVFIVTHMQETFAPPKADLHGGENHNYFVPFAEAMGVSLTYRYDLPKLDDNSLLHRMGADSGSSTQDIRTVVVDNAGHHIKIIEPSKSISFSVAELLGLAGNAKLLDSTLPEAGSNKLPKATYAAGPLARITGLEMMVDIECSDTVHLFDSRDKEDQILTCHMSVDLSRQEWSQVEHFDVIGQNGAKTRHRRYHGIRIQCRTKGRVEYVDFSFVFSSLVSFLVIVKVPKQITYMFMVTSLGHLSRIYQRVFNEVFYLPAEICGIATRLMAAGVSFVGLMDNHSAKGISRARLRERLSAALSQEALDKGEMQHFADFTFQYLTHTEGNGANQIESFHEAVSLRDKPSTVCKRSSPKADESRSNQVIDVHTYAGSCCSAERIGFEDVVRLLDTDRRMTFLERCFLPGTLQDLSGSGLNKGGEIRTQSMNDKGHRDIGDDRSDIEQGTSSFGLGSKCRALSVSYCENGTSAMSTPRSFSCTPKGAARTLAIPRLSLGRFQGGNAIGHDEVIPGTEKLESVIQDVSLSSLSFDLLDGMTLEEEREMFRWSLKAIRAMEERDIERTAEIETHFRRINEVEKASHELERISHETFEGIREYISDRCRVQEQNAKQDTHKIEQAMAEKLSELESAVIDQYVELNFKMELMGAQLHVIGGMPLPFERSELSKENMLGTLRDVEPSTEDHSKTALCTARNLDRC